MTREIKFRAWHKKQEKMFDVMSIAFDDIKNRGRWCNIVYLGAEIGRLAEGEDVILMQYTGLFDKNGKEIYEGDVLKGKFNGVVKWTDENARYNNGWSDFWNDSEIIGNIYENPELLAN